DSARTEGRGQGRLQGAQPHDRSRHARLSKARLKPPGGPPLPPDLRLCTNAPLHPIAEWGRLRFGGAETNDGRRLADLENTLRLVGLDATEYVPLLAPLVDVPLPEERRAKFAP